MSNPLFNQIGQQMPGGILQRFQQFQRMFRGDPRQQVQQLLNSGKVSQSQYDNAVRLANQFQKMIGR